jgi:hypothetical protein
MDISVNQVTALIKSNEKRHDLEQARQQRIQPSHKQIPEQYKQVASEVFRQLTTMRPAWKVGFTNENKTFDQKLVTAYKIQLLQAMQDNGIDDLQKVESGLKALRSQSGQFLPSIGDFITACNPNSKGELNAAMYREYRPERLIASCTEEERKQAAADGLRAIKSLLGR